MYLLTFYTFYRIVGNDNRLKFDTILSWVDFLSSVLVSPNKYPIVKAFYCFQDLFLTFFLLVF